MPQRKPEDDPRKILRTPTLPEVVALKAVAAGNATSDQQQLFYAFLVNVVCGYGQCHAYFGVDAHEKTYLALGKQRVAEILKTYHEEDIRKFKEDGMPSRQVE